LGEPADYPLLVHLADASSSFFLPKLPKSNGLSERFVVLSTYRRLQGNPLEAASDLLREFGEVVPDETIAGIRFTGSGGRTVARAFDAGFENEFRALARSMHALYPQVRTVFEMGGENLKYIRLGATDGSDHLGILDYQSSTECAAGTGSFIVKGRQVVSPVAFVGGVALNAGVRDAVREAFKLQKSDFLVPDLNCWMTALGASMLASEGNGHGTTSTFLRLRGETARAEEFPATEALALDQVTL